MGGGSLQQTIGIIGGDLRQRYLAQLFREAGNTVYGSSLCSDTADLGELPLTDVETVAEKAELIAAPIPFSRDQQHLTGTDVEWMELAGNLRSDQMLFAGVIPEPAARYLRARGIPFLDYMKSEEVALRNAVATAEGAIAEAIRLWPENLTGCSCLVMGYGRCGRLLALKLRQFGAEVSVYARREDVLTAAETEGMHPVSRSLLGEALEQCGILFNTVPAPFLTEGEIDRIRRGGLLLELASGAGCMGNLSINKPFQLVRCPGLPGKYAPLASAKILYHYICRMAEGRMDR